MQVATRVCDCITVYHSYVSTHFGVYDSYELQSVDYLLSIIDNGLEDLLCGNAPADTSLFLIFHSLFACLL